MESEYGSLGTVARAFLAELFVFLPTFRRRVFHSALVAKLWDKTGHDYDRHFAINVCAFLLGIPADCGDRGDSPLIPSFPKAPAAPLKWEAARLGPREEDLR